VAAIHDAGGARYAPRGVMRMLLRLVVLGGLIAAGWLLGSGTSHADEDWDQPGPSPVHFANLTSADALSGDQLGMAAPVGPVVKRALSRASAPRPSTQPPVQAGLLKPVVKAVGGSKPLAKILRPVVRPLSGSGAHGAAIQPPAQVKRAAVVPLEAPAVTAPAEVAAARTPAVAEFTPARPAKPVDAQGAQASSPTKASPVEVATSSVLEQTVTSDAPVAPIPARSPASTTSPCTSGGSGGGTSTKNTSELAVRESWATENLFQGRDRHSRDTSDLPPSLSARPSTSPD
jgi:hypothetical protein